jgi:hypothetical protein
MFANVRSDEGAFSPENAAPIRQESEAAAILAPAWTTDRLL